MYAIISDGSKQYKVMEGDTVRVERLNTDTSSLVPLLIVDGEKVISSTDELSKANIAISVVGDVAGNKIRGFNYKPKANQRKKYGHRQKYQLIKVEKITA